MKKESLYNKLVEYSKNGNYAFHMPGHKRNIKLLEGLDPFDIDITEIEGFDNLHHAEGIIQQAMKDAAGFFGTDRTWFLVNGSSCGILSAIHAVADIGDSIIIGRNCHKAVYHAVELHNLQVHYLYPEYIDEYEINGGYNPQQLEELFHTTDDIKAVVVTSPTYDGIVSDIGKIADIVHSHGAILIVDEAHGAHLGITDQLPKAAYQQGADIVIESIHKTLPSLTQTALLHLQGNRVSSSKIEESLGIFQSTSPSYVFMAAMDRCIQKLRTCGKEQLEKLLMNDRKFRENVNNLKYIQVPAKELIGKHCVFDVDETKLIISVDSNICDGKRLADILRDKYHFEMEMEGAHYVLGITTICDDEAQILRLGDSLKEIDQYFDRNTINKSINYQTEEDECDKIEFKLLKNESSCSVYEAKRSEMEQIEISHSQNRVSGEYLYLYPPGIPLLVPGEVISEMLLRQIQRFQEMGMNLQGLCDKQNRTIRVLKNKGI